MPKSKMNPTVTTVLGKAKKWREEMERLRKIALTLPLDEELKWGKPCYAVEGSNIVLIHGFNEYCALLFMKGALLKDPKGILIQQTENVQSARQIRFTSLKQIMGMEAVIKAYIREAIEVEKSGLEVTFKKTTEFAVPEELQNKFDEMPELKTAFEKLTPGRQRGYLLHFAAPKQSKTRDARIEKCMQQIFEGKGFNE